MKRPFYILALCITLSGCELTPAQQIDLSNQTKALNEQSIAMQMKLSDQLTALRATTLPFTPAPTATNPSPAQVQPTPAAITLEKQQEAPVVKTLEGLAKVTPVINGAAPILTTVVSGQDPGPSIAAAAPLAGPYAGYVMIASIIISNAFALYKWSKQRQSDAAATKNNDAIQSLLASGKLLISNSTAIPAADAIVADHPTGDRLIDVLSASAPKT